MPGHTKRINDRQRALLFAIIAGKTYPEAGRMAGYRDSPHISNTVKHVLRLPQVAAELKTMRAERDRAAELTAEWWRAELLHLYNKVRDKGNATDALRALEIAGKHLGLLDPSRTRDDESERASRLMDNTATLMALQVAIQATSQKTLPEALTLDARVRDVLGASEDTGQEDSDAASYGQDTLDDDPDTPL